MPEDAVDARLQKISTFLDELAINTTENRQVVACLLGLVSVQAAPPLRRPFLLVKRKQYDFIVQGLRQIAKRGPIVLWMEDAHWLDASSAELLQELVAAASDVPLLIIVTRRSFPKEVALPDFDETIELKQISESDALEMATSMPGASELSDEQISRAIEAAEGVPLFIEQLIISLVEEYRRSPDFEADVAVSALLAEKLSGRLDRRPGARRIVQAAAVSGARLHRRFLPHCCNRSLMLSPNHSKRWSRRKILRPRRYGAEIQYEFRHALLQRIAYESMLQPERRAIHLPCCRHARHESNRSSPAGSDCISFYGSRRVS